MSPEVTAVVRVLLAGVLAVGIGLQRELKGKPAGLRTHMLIAIGSALFTVVSIFGFGPGVDVSRVAAGVVAGVGFIGTGVIFRGIRNGGAVAGLTTAASIWSTSAIGVAAGTGMYLLAVVVAAVIVGVLMIPKVRG